MYILVSPQLWKNKKKEKKRKKKRKKKTKHTQIFQNNIDYKICVLVNIKKRSYR